MQLSHPRLVGGVSFDEPNLVSAAGLVPLMRLAERAGLRELADERLSVPADKGARPVRAPAEVVRLTLRVRISAKDSCRRSAGDQHALGRPPAVIRGRAARAGPAIAAVARRR